MDEIATNGYLSQSDSNSLQTESDDLIYGRYSIIEKLGRGTFAETFIAKDAQVQGGHKCILKKLKSQPNNHPGAFADVKERFSQETEVLSKLGEHEQIPQLLNQFEFKGNFYLVQEYIQGKSLGALLEEETQLSPKFSLSLLWDVLQILNFIHGQGVTHQNIHPGNLIYRESDNRWVLVDFGAIKESGKISKQTDSKPRSKRIHDQGYSAPEQLEGVPHPASDLYSLGVICVQCLIKMHPRLFQSMPIEKRLTRLNAAIPSSTMAAIFEKMTREHFQDRFQTAQEVTEALNVVLPLQQKESSWEFKNTPREALITSSHKCFLTQTISTENSDSSTKITIPTEVLQLSQSPKYSKPILSPNSPSSEIPAMEESTDSEPTSQLYWKQLWAGILWWLKAHNITRLEDGIALAVSLCLVIGGSSVLLIWIAKIVSIPRQIQSASTETAEAVTNAPLIFTISGESKITDLVFSADNSSVISADTAGHITAWDLTSQQPIFQSKGFGAINTLAMSQDGGLLASGDEYANIKIWDWPSSKVIDTLRDHQLPIRSLTYSPNGKTLVSTGEDKLLIFWDLETLKPKHQITNLVETITATDISSDSQYLVAGGVDLKLKIWNLNTGKLLNTLPGHSGPIQTIVISPNNAVIVSGSTDQTINVWNLYTGKLLNTLSGHLGAINEVAVSPDSQQIVSGSQDGTIRVWDLYTGELQHKLGNFKGPISAIDISPDGQFIASSTITGQITLWNFPKEANK